MFFRRKPKVTTVTVTLDSRITVEQFRDAIRVAFNTPNTSAQLIEVFHQVEGSLLLSQADWNSVKASLLEGKLKALFGIMLRRRQAHEAVFKYDGPPLSLANYLQKKDGEVQTIRKVTQETRDRVNTNLHNLATSSGHTRFNPLKYFKNKRSRMVKFYDGFNVSTKAGARAWQQKYSPLIAGQQKMLQTDKLVNKFAQSKFTNVRLDKDQADTLVGAQEVGFQTALDMDVSEVSMQEAAQLRYYIYQASHQGHTNIREPHLRGEWRRGAGHRDGHGCAGLRDHSPAGSSKTAN